MRRAAVLACGAWLAAAAHAERLPIGRYVEIHVGVGHAHPYATAGADAHRTGRSRAHLSATAPTMLWHVVLPQRWLTPPIVFADGTLIVGSAGGVYALDPASGAARWFAPIGEVLHSPSITPSGELVAVAAGKLVVFSKQGVTRDLGLPLGKTVPSLVLDSGTVIVAGPEGQLQAVTLDGALLASVVAPSPQTRLHSTAMVGADTVVGASSLSSELTFLSLESGTSRAFHLAEPVETGPLVADDELIWVIGQRGGLFGVSATGQLRVSANIGQGGPSEGPALGWDGGIRVGLRYGEIACFAPNGKERWRRGLDSEPGPMSIDADDTVVFVSTRGTLYAIDRDGDLRWRRALGAHEAGRPVIGADGTMYVVLRGGELQAWR